MRAMTRRPEEYDGPGEPVAGDVFDRASLTDPLAGVDVAVYLVHSLDDPDFEQKDADAARTFAKAAAAGGVRQIVYLGGLGSDDDTLSPTCAPPGGGAAAGRDGGAGDRAARRHRGRRRRHLLGAHPPAGQEPAGDGGPPLGPTQTQPIALDDVIRYLAGVVGLAEAFGRLFEIGGPESLTYLEMLQVAAEVSAVTGSRSSRCRC